MAPAAGTAMPCPYISSKAGGARSSKAGGARSTRPPYAAIKQFARSARLRWHRLSSLFLPLRWHRLSSLWDAGRDAPPTGPITHGASGGHGDAVPLRPLPGLAASESQTDCMPTLKVRLRPWWHTYEETRDGSAPGLWALARFLHRKQLPGEKEKNVLAGCQPRPVVPKACSEGLQAERFPSSCQSILFLLACIRNPRCTKACQSPQPQPPSRPRAGFLHSLRLSSLFLHLRWHRLSSLWDAGRDAPPTGPTTHLPRPAAPEVHAHRMRQSNSSRALRASGGTGFPAYSCLSGGTGFPACETRGETPRLQEPITHGAGGGHGGAVPLRPLQDWPQANHRPIACPPSRFA